jgi:thiol-disulfide isomerase/thioredoxin
MEKHTREIITKLSVAELQLIQTKLAHKVLLVKFGATWCGPCKKIKPQCEEWLNTCPPNIIYADIDIDESVELYMQLKKNKMVNGIPVILAFYDTNTPRDKWFIPNDSVTGSGPTLVQAFLDRCFDKANSLI